MIHLGVDIFGIYHPWYSLNFLSLWFSFVINSGKFSNISSNILSVLFLLVFPICVNLLYLFHSSQIILLPFFFLIFSYSPRADPIDIPSNSLILSLAVVSSLVSSSKAFFISFIMYKLIAFDFYSFHSI